MGQQYQALVAVATGAYTPITASTWARYVEIAEDGAAAPGGIRVKWPNGTVDTYTPSMQPVKIGNPSGNTGPFVGAPADAISGRAATQYCQIESVGATSSIRVMEQN